MYKDAHYVHPNMHMHAYYVHSRRTCTHALYIETPLRMLQVCCCMYIQTPVPAHLSLDACTTYARLGSVPRHYQASGRAGAEEEGAGAAGEGPEGDCEAEPLPGGIRVAMTREELPVALDQQAPVSHPWSLSPGFQIPGPVVGPPKKK